MNTIQLQQRLVNVNIENNPKLRKALEVFEQAQKTYEKAIGAMTIKQKPKYYGTYSSSLSKKDYYASISTNTQ